MNYRIGDTFRKEWNRVRRKLDTLSGPGVHNAREYITISPPPPGSGRRLATDDNLPVRMKIKTAADSNGVAVCQFVDADGDVPSGAGDIPVKVGPTRAVGAYLFVMQCSPNAGVEFDEEPVTWIELALNPVALVKVTGNRTGGGKYAGKVIVHSTSSLSYSGNLSESEVGTVTNAIDCTVINANERSLSTHALTAGTQVTHHFIAFLMPYTDQDGLPVYLINGLDSKVCT